MKPFAVGLLFFALLQGCNFDHAYNEIKNQQALAPEQEEESTPRGDTQKSLACLDQVDLNLPSTKGLFDVEITIGQTPYSEFKYLYFDDIFLTPENMQISGSMDQGAFKIVIGKPILGRHQIGDEGNDLMMIWYPWCGIFTCLEGTMAAGLHQDQILGNGYIDLFYDQNDLLHLVFELQIQDIKDESKNLVFFQGEMIESDCTQATMP